jgi:hypothetical protein
VAAQFLDSGAYRHPLRGHPKPCLAQARRGPGYGLAHIVILACCPGLTCKTCRACSKLRHRFFLGEWEPDDVSTVSEPLKGPEMVLVRGWAAYYRMVVSSET